MESTRCFLKLVRDFTGSVAEKLSTAGTTCEVVKGPRTRARGPMQQYNVGSPLERIAVGIADSFPVTKDWNKYMMVVSDYFSK